MEVTIAIQIGNSDDKLTQSEWSEFVEEMRDCVAVHASMVHFFGASENYKLWQNAAWILVCNESVIERFKQEIKDIRETFKQDSVAWLQGDTEFI